MELVKVLDLLTTEDKAKLRQGLIDLVLEVARTDLTEFLATNYFIDWDDLAQEVMKDAKAQLVDEYEAALRKVLAEKKEQSVKGEKLWDSITE